LTPDVESSKATVPKEKTTKDKVATKSVVQQGINLKSEVTDQLSQLTAAAEIGLLTEASQDKTVALKKAKKSGVSYSNGKVCLIKTY
jgi:hypothetical protein